MIRFRIRKALFAALSMLVVVIGSDANAELESASDEQVAKATERPDAGAVRKKFNLPGVVVNFQKRRVDIEATVCLDQGMLELIACTRGSKEHESIVAIKARPMHVHTALLLLGAKNGNPMMHKMVDEEGERWIHVPSQGGPVDVSLVIENEKGKQIERPISDFVIRSEEMADQFAPGDRIVDKGEADEARQFPNTFLFAGSYLLEAEEGPRQYLADQSGHVISIATFGDELLCLPGEHATDNGSLVWEANSETLPKVGSQVTLRLRPKLKPEAKTDKVLPKAVSAVEKRRVEQTKPLPRVLLIGDSISGGYQKGVKKLLAGKAVVIKNQGNAQHTGTGLKKIDEWLGKGKWDVIHFNWGLHDVAHRNLKSKNFGHLDKVAGKLTTPLADYEKNLRKLVARLNQTGATLVWASTTPVPEGEPGRIKGDEIKYNAVAAKIMKKNEIAIDDLHAEVIRLGRPKTNNVHDTGDLSRQVADSILAALASRESRVLGPGDFSD